MTWYRDGLPFHCTGCGACCTGSPGYVWVTREEIEEIAQFLGVSPEEFIKNQTRSIDGHLSLLEKDHPYDCYFLKDKKCQIYPVRPKQCKSFPWWPENIASQENWNETAKRCEGVNHKESKIYSPEEIHDELFS